MRIGTRSSDLGLWQARHVQWLLAERAGVETKLVILESRGGQILDCSLAELGCMATLTPGGVNLCALLEREGLGLVYAEATALKPRAAEAVALVTLISEPDTRSAHDTA